MPKFVKDSKNSKIAGKYKVCATYAPIKQTCPDICSLKNEGCYAQLGHTGLHNSRLEQQFTGLSPEVIAVFEAGAIDAAFPKGVPQDGARGGRDLRLHVSGDCRTHPAAAIVSEAARRYVARGGGVVWSYTHAWRDVPKSAWAGVSVLASIERPEDAVLALSAGYAPAIVVPEFESNKAYLIGSVKFIPCPAQTREDTACVDCRLCLNAEGLLSRNSGIAFAAHGVKTKSLKKHLTVVS
jgi:hypothetical protein